MKVKSLKATLYRFDRDSFLQLVHEVYPFLANEFLASYSNSNFRENQLAKIDKVISKQEKIEQKLR